MNARGMVAAGAVAMVCALVMVGCGMVDTGVRVDEGGGDGTTRPGPEPPPVATSEDEAISVDPVAVLREDPGVRQNVKDVVARPCSGEGYSEGWYPVYANYGTIAGTDIPIVIINVQGCADVVACSGMYASYVYRLGEGRTERIYAPEDPMSQVTLTDGELFEQRPIWGPNDPSDCPGHLDMVRLTWNGSELDAERD